MGNKTQYARQHIGRRIAALNDDIEREKAFLACGASNDIDYQMSQARLRALRAERDHLKEILGDYE